MNQRQRRAAELKLRSALRVYHLEHMPVDEYGVKICPQCRRRRDWRGWHLIHKLAIRRGGTTLENTWVGCARCHFGEDKELGGHCLNEKEAEPQWSKKEIT